MFDLLRGQEARVGRIADDVFEFYFFEHVMVSSAIESIVASRLVDDDIAIGVLISHALAKQASLPVCLSMRDLLSNTHEGEQALGMLCTARQHKEDVIAFIGSMPKIVSADAPSRGLGPEMGVIVDPSLTATAGIATNRVKRAGDIHQAFHCNG